MALRFSAVNLPLDGGLDEKTADILKQPPTADELINVTWDKIGRIQCRPYLDALSTASFTSERSIVAGRDEMLVFDELGASHYIDGAFVRQNAYIDTAKQILTDYRKHKLPCQANPGTSNITTRVSSVRGQDVTLSVVFESIDYTEFVVYITKNDTGQHVNKTRVSSTTIGSVKPVVHSNGTIFAVAYGDTTRFRCFTYNSATDTFSSTTNHTGAFNYSTSPIVCCNGHSSIDPAFFVLAGSSATTAVDAFTVNSSGTITEYDLTLASSALLGLLACCTHTNVGASDVDGYVLFYEDNATNDVHWEELSTSIVNLATYNGTDIPYVDIHGQFGAVQAWPLGTSSDKYFLFWEDGSNSIFNATLDSTGIVLSGITLNHHRLFSTPQKHPNTNDIIVAVLPLGNDFSDSLSVLTTNSFYLLANEGVRMAVTVAMDSGVYGLIPVANLALYNSANGSYLASGLSTLSVFGNVATFASFYSRGNNKGAEYHEVDFDPDYVPRSESGNEIIVGNGLVYSFDGKIAAEISPSSPPYIWSRTTSGAAAGSYGYRAVLEYFDQKGVLHRSEPSNALTGVTIGATHTDVVISAPDLFIQNEFDDPTDYVRIALYRTANGGSIYYRVPTVSSVTYSSATGRFTVRELGNGNPSSNEVLYTHSSLPSQAAPAMCFIVKYNGRICGISSEQRRDIWMSQPVTVHVAPEFNSALAYTVPSQEDLVALGVVDDKLIAFSKKETFIIYGQGPDRLGRGSGFQDSQVSSGVGCINPASVVSGPFGVIFQADSGIYMIDRGMQPTFVGANVQGIEGTIKAAVLDQSRHSVLFCKTSGAIEYNYLQGRWSVWDECSFKDASLYGTEVVFVDADSATNGIETGKFSSSFTTKGNYDLPTLTYTSPWVALAGIQGAKRVRRVQFLLDEINASYDGDITVTSYYDYDTAVSHSETFTAAEWAASYPRQIEYELPIQDIESFRLKVELEPTVALSAGVALTQMRVLVAQKRGLYNLPAGARK